MTKPIKLNSGVLEEFNTDEKINTDNLPNFVVCSDISDGESGAVPQPLASEESYYLNAGSGWTSINVSNLGSIGTDKLLGRFSPGSGPIEEVTCTDFIQSLLDDTGASQARATLGAQQSISGLSLFSLTPVTDDKILIQDTSGTNALKYATPSTVLSMPIIITERTDTVITASDEILFSDASDSGNLKKDTVQGILDLVPAGVPSGSLMPYAGTSAPSGWLFSYGQAVSRTTYADLFTAISTTYGAGDGSTTFNLPDLRGNVVAGKDDMGGVSSNKLTGLSGGVDGDNLGDTGGSESHLLLSSESGVPAHTHPYVDRYNVNDNVFANGTANRKNTLNSINTTTSANSAANAASAHNNVQPTIILNYIIKT